MSKKSKQRKGKRAAAVIKQDGRFVRWGAAAVGVLFLVAGGAKMLDPWSFHAALPGYGIDGAARSLLSAFLPGIEIAIGVALLARWGVRQVSLAAVGFLGVFVVAIGYGWWAGSLEECGCFGPLLKRSPRDAMLIDLVFLGVAAAVWKQATAGKLLEGWHKAVLGFVAVVGLGVTLSLLQAGPSGVAAATSTIGGELSGIDLNSGEHLFYLFHHECPRCAEMSPRVAEYGEAGGIPPVVGFTFLTSQRQIDSYRDQYDLRIPVQVLPGDMFTRITGDGAVPQLVFVRNGELVRKWRGLIPESADLRLALQETD